MKPTERNDFKHRLQLLAVLLFFGLAASAQTLKVSGTVTDPKGEPLIGVTIKVLNGGKTSAGAVTDIDGKYSLSVPSSSSLEFSYIRI